MPCHGCMGHVNHTRSSVFSNQKLLKYILLHIPLLRNSSAGNDINNYKSLTCIVVVSHYMLDIASPPDLLFVLTFPTDTSAAESFSSPTSDDPDVAPHAYAYMHLNQLQVLPAQRVGASGNRWIAVRCTPAVLWVCAPRRHEISSLSKHGRSIDGDRCFDHRAVSAPRALQFVPNSSPPLHHAHRSTRR